jgi:hypothetical protein
MRNVINTTANVSITAIVNRSVVRTSMAGVVDALRVAPRSLRLYHATAKAALAPQHWDHATGQKPFAGKQKPAGMGPMPGSGSELLSRCSRRETSRCRRPRVSSCIARS